MALLGSLSVSNVQFESTGTARFDYQANSIINIYGDAIRLPVGPVESRPNSGAVFQGIVRYNSNTASPEFYNGSFWVEYYKPPTVNNSNIIQSVFYSPSENINISATAANSNINFNVLTQGMLWYSNNATGSWTLNVRGNSTVRLDQAMSAGQSFTISFMANIGSGLFFQSAFQIDGAAHTPKWQNSIVPAAGIANTIDIYSFSVMKKAANSFAIFGSVSNFG